MEQRRMEHHDESWRCIACKNKHSNERCISRKKPGSDLCGIHINARNLRLWSKLFLISESNISLITKFQALWRGFFQRKLNSLRGEGLLKRSICMNESELVSGDDKDKFGIEYYFSINDENKIYWFDVRSIFKWTFGKLSPTNPYTRAEIKLEDMIRLRELVRCLYIHKNIKVLFEALSEIPFSERSFNLSIYLVRRFREIGFESFSPSWIMELTPNNRHIFCKFMYEALQNLSEKDKLYIGLNIDNEILTNLFKKYKWNTMDYEQANFRLSEIILKLLDLNKNPKQEYFIMLLIIQSLNMVINIDI